METLVSILILVLIFILFYYLLQMFLTNLGTDAKTAGLVKAIFILIAIIFLLTILFGGWELPTIHFRKR